MILQSEYDAMMRRKRLKVLFVVFVIVAFIGALFFIVRIIQERISMRNTPPKPDIPLVSSPEPKKTDFGTNIPTDFPSDIPLEKDAKITQSYSLDYPGQKQLSIAFLSMKTMEENGNIYIDFFKKQGWASNVQSFLTTQDDQTFNTAVFSALKKSTGMRVTIEPILVSHDVTMADSKDKHMQSGMQMTSSVSIDIFLKEF